MHLDGRVAATSSGTDVERVKENLLDTYFRRPPKQPPKRQRKRKPR